MDTNSSGKTTVMKAVIHEGLRVARGMASSKNNHSCYGIKDNNAQSEFILKKIER